MSKEELIPLGAFPASKYNCSYLDSDVITTDDDDIEINMCDYARHHRHDSDTTCVHDGDHCRFFRRKTPDEEEAERNSASIIVQKVSRDGIAVLGSYMRYIIGHMDRSGVKIHREHYAGASADLVDMKVGDLDDCQRLTLITDWLMDSSLDPNVDYDALVSLIADEDIVAELTKRINKGRIRQKLILEVFK